jgi:glycerate 2-kinase
MKIIIAPDKFKGCLSANEVAEAMARGVRAAGVSVEVDLCPMADGGEGTVEAMVAATGGRVEMRKVTGPLPGMRVEAPIGLLGDGQTAVIEMAAASGMHLLEEKKRNPMRTTTYGTGELMRHAIDLGAKQVIIGIGGSATIDGGIGAVQGWGGRIVLGNEQVYSRGDRVLVGADVARIAAIEVDGMTVVRPARAAAGAVAQQLRRQLPGVKEGVGSNGGEEKERDPFSSVVRPARAAAVRANAQQPRLEGPAGKAPRFVIASDVGNPLYGPHGAAEIFGPQKGATAEQVKQLDQALERLAKRSHAPHLAEAPGAGAAGGLGFGLMSFFGGQVRSGVEIVIEATGLRERLRGADLCITGEGQLDQQTLTGKTCIGVARVCREMNVPCVAIAGTVLEGVEPAREEGLTAWFSICDRPMSLAEAMADAGRLLSAAAGNVVRVFRAGGPPMNTDEHG